ncbi:MAG: hypothetical protein K0S65_3639 [Labilithrix sp.]|nr:hypothetical protein [Labilithrix sp.]
MATEPAVKIGQTWRRNSDGKLFTIAQQMFDEKNLVDEDDWRLRDAESNKLGGWIFGFSLRRRYELVEEAE